MNVHGRRRWVLSGLVGLSSLAGAPAVPAAPAEGSAAATDWRKARAHWAFQLPKPASSVRLRQERWVRQPLDRLVLARLEARRILPTPEASRATWIRRVTFDLTGLPPTPEEVAAFESDTAGGAHERVVDRLLASPRFGQRLASLWLPLARYAEDQAHQVGADTKFFYPNAFHYRDWVVSAFNRDLPYDQFVRLQIAADRYPEVPKTELAALGFLGLGPKYYNRNRLDVMADEWQDRIDTVTRTFQGLTVACARCHDHKYDPVTQRDYYALAGIFASTRMVNKTPDGVVEPGNVEAAKMRKETLHTVEEGDAKDVPVYLRGNVETPGDMAPRRYLRVLSDDEPAPFSRGSGRQELAETLSAPTNPLTARVMVNRLWGLCFGTPLVGTPSNFGLIGSPPTHPELLDDLAVRFIRSGWRVKPLLREMVLSATYRQSADRKGSFPDADPANSLRWRMNRRRLTVEQWRDSLLAVSGELDETEGPSFQLDDPNARRRTLYAFVSRLKLNDTLLQFDYPDANVHAEARSNTTTPMQRLLLMNGPFMLARARNLAARLVREQPAGDDARIDLAYRLLFSRRPSDRESRLGRDFLASTPVSSASPGGTAGGAPVSPTPWEQYVHALMMSNEALYVD